MADVVFVVLLILHIAFIAIWAGAATLFSSIVAPALQKISPSSRAEFVIEILPRYTRFIVGTATGAIVVGVILYGYIIRVATSYAPSSSGLPFIEAGAVSGLIAYAIAVGVVYPTANKLVSKLKMMPKPAKAGDPSVLEVARLQNRLRAGAGSAAGILALTLVLMVVGASI